MRRVRDYAQVKGDGVITQQMAEQALDMLSVDDQGFDHLDRRFLLALIEKFEGGPVGIDSLAAALSEERGTLEDVIEPYLIQQGLIVRTPAVAWRRMPPIDTLLCLYHRQASHQLRTRRICHLI